MKSIKIAALLVIIFLTLCGFYLIVHRAYNTQAATVNCTGGCNGWWSVELSDGPGLLGGIATQIVAENIKSNDGYFGYYMFLVDHGNGNNCLTANHSVYVYTGLENDSTQTGEYPMWGDCRPNQGLYIHDGSYLPSNDYGVPFYMNIVQTGTSGEWQVHDFDAYGRVQDFWYSIENWMTPYAWRMGSVLYSDNTPSTNGTTTLFTNNEWCPNTNFSGSCDLQFYHGKASIIYNNPPLATKWDQLPQCSATGGVLEAAVN